LRLRRFSLACQALTVLVFAAPDFAGRDFEDLRFSLILTIFLTAATLLLLGVFSDIGQTSWMKSANRRPSAW
jgi:hypothetical protein